MTDPLNTTAVRRYPATGTSLPPGIVAAFARAELVNHEFGLAWLTNLANHALPDNEQAYIYVAQQSDHEFVALPLRLNAKTGAASALSTWYTSLYAPVASGSEVQPLYAAIFRHLAREERATTLTLSPLDGEAPDTTALQHALTQGGWHGIHQWDCFGNWIHDLPTSDFDHYLASRPPIVRNTLRRKTRKFLREGHGDLRLITGGDDLYDSIAQFQQVYRSSWKQNEPYPEFIPALIDLAASRGWLRLGLACYQGQPVAAQIWLVSNGTASIFKLAYDESHKSLSPGTVLTAFLAQQVIEQDRVSRIDYLSGDDSYKKDWMSTRRQRVGIAAYNRQTGRGVAALISHTLKTRLKSIARAIPAAAT